MKKFIALFIFCLSVVDILACINPDTKVLKNGILVYRDDFQLEHEVMVPVGHRFRNINNRLIRSLDSLYHATKDIDYLSDKGYVLILQGKYEEAIKLYLAIERIHPHRYSTASNVGTAYELAGKPKNALQWIKKAVSIDSTSHNYSEWLHVKILEAKIKGEEAITPDFLINTNFGDEPIPVTTLSRDALSDLLNQIHVQLQERLSFVKPKDKIVAQLLFELGNLNYLLDDKKSGLAIFKKAEVYGYDNFLIKQRMDVSEGKKPRTKPAEPTTVNLSWVFWTGGILVVALVFFFWMESKAKRI